ncbi:MAG: hypothetical protein Kow00129_04780 [Thermoleophilia bacterium]
MFALGILGALVNSALQAPEDNETEAAGPEATSTASTATADLEETAEDEDEPEPPPRSTTSSVYIGPVREVQVADVRASSYLDPTEHNTYDPANMLDGELATAWNEGAEGVGEGEWFRLSFESPVPVRRMEIANGYQKDSDRFLGNARIREMDIKLSDGTTITAVLENEQGYQTVELPGRETEWLLITVTDAYGGDVWEDLAVSEIRVYADAG